jgi:hypothetical protein
MSAVKKAWPQFSAPNFHHPEYAAYVADTVEWILSERTRQNALELRADFDIDDIRGRELTPYEKRRLGRTREASARHSIWARDNIAGALTWTQGKPFTPMQLAEGRSKSQADDAAWRQRFHVGSAVWDHPEFYRYGNTPVAVIVHVYCANAAEAHQECSAFAAAARLQFILMRWSWHNPQCCAGIYLSPVRGKP